MADARFQQPEFSRFVVRAAETADLLWRKGWAEGSAGNLSQDVTDWVDPGPFPEHDPAPCWCPPGEPPPECAASLAGRCLWITAAGGRMRDVSREPGEHSGTLQFSADGLRYRAIGGPAGEDGFRPSSELPSHATILASFLVRGDAPRAIVHAHPDGLIALSHDRSLCDEERLNRALRNMHPEAVAVLPEGIGLVPYVLPGTLQHGLVTAAALERHPVALWEKHGVVAVGADLDEAFDRIDMADKLARLYLSCRAAGIEPEGLGDARLEDLVRFFGDRKRA